MKHAKNITTIHATPPKLSTPSDIDSKRRKEIALAINPLVADAFALFVKTKNFHWHMSGSHYRDYHLLLDEQANQLFAMIDVLAERVRKLGELTIHSISELARLQTIHDDNDLFIKPKDMLQRLLDDNKHFAKHLRTVHEICNKNEDIATASLLENYVDETERRTWFLYETTMID